MDHFQRTHGGHFEVVHGPISFTVTFGDQHCRSVDPNYQFKVVRTEPRLAHPNIRGGLVCLGFGFKPASRLRSIVQAFYLLVSGRVAATDHPFDPVVARYYLKHQDEVLALAAAPLWRRPIAAKVRVEARDRAAFEGTVR